MFKVVLEVPPENLANKFFQAYLKGLEIDYQPLQRELVQFTSKEYWPLAKMMEDTFDADMEPKRLLAEMRAIEVGPLHH